MSSIFSFLVSEQPLPTTPADFSKLSEKDKACCENIIKEIFTLLSNASRAKPRTKIGETHAIYSLIFTQSKSWEKAINLCSLIENQKDPEDPAAKKNLDAIKDYASKIQKAIRTLLQLNSEVQTHLVSKLPPAELTKLVSEAQQSIKTQIDLIQHLVSLAQSGPAKTFFSKHGQGAPIQLFQFLNDNWDRLTLFYLRYEILMLESNLYVTIQPKPPHIELPSDEKLQTIVDRFSSIEAIYLIQTTVQSSGYQNAITQCSHHSTSKQHPNPRQKRIENIVNLALHEINYRLNTRKARLTSTSVASDLPGIFYSILGFK